MLKIQNLSKHFSGVKAVDNCSFEVEIGKITALIGPNGSGKSTIFKLISGVLKSDQGQIIFNGKKITNFPVNIISNLGISRIFQESQLFNNITVKDNLLLAFDNEDVKFWKNFFGLNKVTREKEKTVEEMLKFINMYGYEQKLLRELSYGQKRLIEIARALINPHFILMLDEPAAGVAPSLNKKITHLLLDLKKKKETIFIIDHDMDFVSEIADNVIIIDGGKIIAKGGIEKIKKDKRVSGVYFGGINC